MPHIRAFGLVHVLSERPLAYGYCLERLIWTNTRSSALAGGTAMGSRGLCVSETCIAEKSWFQVDVDDWHCCQTNLISLRHMYV